MRIRLCTLLLLAALAAPATAEDLVLKNVNVVDVDSGAIIAGRSVVVRDGQIKEIGTQESPGIQGALAARQKSIEHLRGYIEKLVPADAPIQPGINMRSRTLAWEYADMSRIPELVRATRGAGAWQCPTLGTSIYTAPSGAIERYLATPEAEYLDPQTREAFRHRGRVKWLSNFTEADFERATHANDKQAVLLRAMHQAGVPLLGSSAACMSFRQTAAVPGLRQNAEQIDPVDLLALVFDKLKEQHATVRTQPRSRFQQRRLTADRLCRGTSSPK